MKDKFIGIFKEKTTWLKLAVIFLPVIQAGVIALFYWMTKGSGLPMPMWNDEGAYYELIKTWLATGQPLGYWGFDGGHAIVGTGSAWSPAILFPYAVFGMMFGWNYSSAFFANVLFLTLAQILFMLLVQPEKKHLVRMLLLQGLSVIVILYSTTLMSELLRFSLAIVLAGMMYRLYFGQCGKAFKFVLAPLYLVALVQVYIFFVFAVPIYVFGAVKEWKWWKKAVLSLVALVIVGGGSYYLLHLISSNYNIYKTENLLKALQNFDITGAVWSVLAMVKEGLWGLWSCFRTGVGHGMFKWFVPFLFMLILVPGGMLLVDGWKCFGAKKCDVKKRDEAEGKDKTSGDEVTEKAGKVFWNHDRTICLQVAFGVALFLGAFITVYSLEAFTFYRSLGIVVIFSMYLLMMTKSKWLYPVMMIFFGVGMIFLPANMKDFSMERYPGAEVRRQWDAFADEMDDVILVAEGVNPWKNTIAMFTLEPKVLASMPAGSGVNMMLYSDEIPADVEYLFFSKEKENLRSDWLEHDYYAILSANQALLDAEYAVIFEDADYIIYRKN